MASGLNEIMALSQGRHFEIVPQKNCVSNAFLMHGNLKKLFAFWKVRGDSEFPIKYTEKHGLFDKKASCGRALCSKKNLVR